MNIVTQCFSQDQQFVAIFEGPRTLENVYFTSVITMEF